MSTLVLAVDLHAGDYVKTGGKTVMLHRIPIERSKSFTAGWMRSQPHGDSGEVTFEPDEQVEVISRFPERVVL